MPTEKYARDENELTASLAGLSGLLTGEQAIEKTLVQIGDLAVRAIPGADGAGLTMLESGRRQTVVATEAFVREVDDIQYGLDQGPCVMAVATGRTHVSGNLGGEKQWPRFGPRAGRLGVHSALSLPLLLGDQVLGALNIYARNRDAFAPHAVQLGEAFAGPAAVSVANVHTLIQTQRLVGQLEQALLSRAEIDQAIGVVMSRSGVSADEAFARLRELSQTQQVKLADVAHQILQELASRTRARHTGTSPDPTA